MIEKRDFDINGVPYNYWSCEKCGREVLDMKQLEETARMYNKLKRYSVKISKWGDAVAFRVPKEIVKQQKLKVGNNVYIIPEKKGFKVVPEKI